MVGLSDIPCVGKAVDRISDAIVDAGIRGLRYLLCYKRLVNNLSSEVEKVKVREEEVARKADADRADGKAIKDHVIKWQKSVEEIKTRADILSKQRTSWNPVTSFQQGRKAAKEVKNANELFLSGAELLANEIAFLPADENMPISDTMYQKFDSRKQAYVKLWDALVKDDGHPIIGIYGMPGVGKTRMMEEAWKDANENNIFDKVARANVGSEKVDVIKLQNQLAGYLNCHLESEDNEVRRASQLKASLINWGKTLIILDDVWSPIPLKNIGIPLGNDIPKGCKILLTSRKEYVCLHNDCNDPIKIEALMDDEAWGMFKNTVGTLKIDSLQDKSLAEKVCKECAGLPLLINAVGNAVKFVSEDSWMDALYQLENCNLEEIDGIESPVYTCIKLSFDKLPEVERTCLLLCSLFPEDFEIELKMLQDFATASQLLDRGRNVRGLIDKLKASSLLLEGETNHTVKLHDVIRDVARSIAARDEQYAFCFIRGGSCLPNNVKYHTRRLLQVVESVLCPTDMVCPFLHTLWLEGDNKPQQFSKSFFEGLDNLKVLVFVGMQIFPENIYDRTFDNLTMLILDDCDLNEISLSIVPQNLETLIISACRLQDPIDLSKLKSLRKLQVFCDREIEIVQNAILSLPPTLVELHIPSGFRICDVEGKTSVPISSELNKLTQLTSLNIRLEDSKCCPDENIVMKLLDFNIDVGYKSWSHTRYMRSVLFCNRCIEGGGEVLVERAEAVILEDVKGSSNGFRYNNREAFSTLKELSIYSSQDMEHIVAWKPHYDVQQSQPVTSFSNLTGLDVSDCSGLKYLFPASAAQSLVQLRILNIKNCSTLELVIRKESTIDEVIIQLPKLKNLCLENLPSLRKFCGEKRGRSSSSITIMENASTSAASGSDSLFDGKVSFPVLETLYIECVNTSEIWENNSYGSDSFCKLKLLNIRFCDFLEFAIPQAMLSTFQNLELLKICGCGSLTSEVESSSANECGDIGELTLVALRSIEFFHIPSLARTRLNSRRNLYPNLETLSIQECHKLQNVFQPSIAKHLLHLKKLVVEECNMMSEIIGEEEGKEERIDKFTFPELTTLELESLPNFKSFCFNVSVEAPHHQSYLAPKVSFPKLVVLQFKLKTINLDEIELGRDDSPTDLTKLLVLCDNKVQLPSKWQLHCTSIEELSLENCWWHGYLHIFNNRCIEGGGNVLLERAEESFPMDAKGSPNGLSNSNREAFANLNTLSIRCCDDMEHVACMPLYEIQQSQPLTTFSKLTSLYIKSCSGLKYLFSTSVAECLVLLENLCIKKCAKLEVVIRNESGTDGVIIKFPKLNDLFLEDLPSLRRFYGENRGGRSTSTTTMENANAATPVPAGSESLFGGMVEFPVLETFTIKSLDISEIWGKNRCKNNSFCQLNLLKIDGCDNLKFAIPLTMLPVFQNLNKLLIWNCKSMSSEFESSNSPNECLRQLDALLAIGLYNMPALTQTGLNSRRRNLYPNLERLEIQQCNSLRNVFLFSTTKDLVQLHYLVVGKCEMMSEIIGEEEREEDRNYAFVLPELTYLELDSLPNIKRFCCNDAMEAATISHQHQSFSTPKLCFPKLKKLYFSGKAITLEGIESWAEIIPTV